MKVNIKVTKEVELDKIIVKAGVRYWCDCKYSEDGGNTWVEPENDDEATDEEFKKKLPFVYREDIGYKPSDYWNITIDVNTGKVKDWPKNFCLSTHFKVCDDGLYQVIDTEGNIIWDSMETRYYYVPDFLAIGDEGYGDYMYLDIDKDGYIKDWETDGLPALRDLIEQSNEEDEY